MNNVSPLPHSLRLLHIPSPSLLTMTLRKPNLSIVHLSISTIVRIRLGINHLLRLFFKDLGLKLNHEFVIWVFGFAWNQWFGFSDSHETGGWNFLFWAWHHLVGLGIWSERSFTNSKARGWEEEYDQRTNETKNREQDNQKRRMIYEGN